MAVIARVYPLLPDKVPALRSFVAELRRRARDTDDFYARHGVERETCHLQHTAFGDFLVVWTEGDADAHPPANYAASAHDFDSWFKNRIHELTGVDPNSTPTGPEAEEIFDWRAPGWSRRADER